MTPDEHEVVYFGPVTCYEWRCSCGKAGIEATGYDARQALLRHKAETEGSR